MSHNIVHLDDAIESAPQPRPMYRGERVSDKLIEFLKGLQVDRAIIDDGIELIRQRSAFGIKKYGQPLMSQDGRDTLRDAEDELGDLIQYAFKARMNGDNLSRIRNLSQLLDAVCGEEDV